MPLVGRETDASEVASEEQSTVDPENPPATDGGQEDGTEPPVSTVPSGGALSPDEGEETMPKDEDEFGEEEDDEKGLDEEQEKKYNEIMIKIQTQNRVVNEIKAEIQKRMEKCPRTKCEEREIGILKICMEQENLKLQCFLKEAICMQQEFPNRKWPQIPLATTYDEECMPLNYQQHLNSKEPSDPCVFSKFMQKDDGSTNDSCQRLYQNMPQCIKQSSCETDEPSVDDVSSKDQMIDCLQRQIANMCKKIPDSNNKRSKKCNGNGNGPNIKNFVNALDQIQVEFQKLKVDVESVKRDRMKQGPKRSDFAYRGEQSLGPRGEQDGLKQKYCDLLEEFAKKDREFVDLKKKMKAFAEEKTGQDPSNVEMRMLREQAAEMMEEQDEYKVLICEQSKQIEDYREKYLKAQQMVEEQKCLLQRQDLDNKRVEDQINTEMQRVKDQFEKKLQEYAQLPKLLENEQLKLAKSCKEKQELETKLCIVCRELKALKKPKNGTGGVPECENCKRLEKELANLKSQLENANMASKRLMERNQQITKELDCLRCESAKIIARLKERAESNQDTLQKHIDQLEKELAQCRATASLSIADREDVIKDMKAQLNCLSLSFDSAQKQIKTLKDHICCISSCAGN